MERTDRISSIRCERLVLQGYGDLHVSVLAALAPWLRFTPALCGLGIALGTLFAAVPILLVMLGMAMFGAILPWHPFDLLYTHGVRYLTHTPPLPRNRAPRRLAMGVCAVCIAITTGAFAAGATAVGYLLGGMTFMGPAMVTATDICVPSLLYHRARRFSRSMPRS